MDTRRIISFLNIEHAEITVIKNIVHAIIKLANLRTFFKVHQINYPYINLHIGMHRPL